MKSIKSEIQTILRKDDVIIDTDHGISYLLVGTDCVSVNDDIVYGTDEDENYKEIKISDIVRFKKA